MKKQTKIIWITAIVSTLILFLIEKFTGMGIGLIGLGGGGEVDSKLTFGGFVLETYYPLTTSDDPYRGPSSQLFFEPVLFTVMFFVRMIIIIPLVLLFVSPEESHSHCSPENVDEQSSSTTGRMHGFLKFFIILYIVIGVVLTGILIYESIGFCEAIKDISSAAKITKRLTSRRNLLLTFMVFDLIFVLHHFITSGLILKKKHSFFLFYKTSYPVTFLITIAAVVILFIGGVRYLPYSFFKWHTLIYFLDLILFMINLSYLRDSYDVYRYMNNDDSYAKLKLFK